MRYFLCVCSSQFTLLSPVFLLFFGVASSAHPFLCAIAADSFFCFTFVWLLYIYIPFKCVRCCSATCSNQFSAFFHSFFFSHKICLNILFCCFVRPRPLIIENDFYAFFVSFSWNGHWKWVNKHEEHNRTELNARRTWTQERTEIQLNAFFSVRIKRKNSETALELILFIFFRFCNWRVVFGLLLFHLILCGCLLSTWFLSRPRQQLMHFVNHTHYLIN